MIAHPDAHAWSIGDLGLAIGMWTGMMAAMMLPSVTPWVLALARLSGDAGNARPRLRVGEFLAGYLLIWSAYSVGAALLQWQLHDRAMLSGLGTIVSPAAGGALLLVAGIFQWTPIKQACLMHCRSPIRFFLTSWKSGRFGALRMGVHHGLFCVACCWGLMALSFVAGVMNLAWMAVITLFIFVDHALLRRDWLSRTAGIMLVVWGIAIIAQAM